MTYSRMTFALGVNTALSEPDVCKALVDDTTGHDEWHTAQLGGSVVEVSLPAEGWPTQLPDVSSER